MNSTHVFIKGISGRGIFYRSEDLIVLITIISVLVRIMGLTIIAFCPMFNHIHLLFKDIGLKELRPFIMRLVRLFVKEYNTGYGRSGSVFERPFGYSFKKGLKITLGSVAYVFNNPVAGNLKKNANDYKWNLLAYRNCRNPYSGKFWKKNCRKELRNAADMVDYLYREGRYLSYRVLNGILNDLDADEKKQITDYILFKYSFVSYKFLEELYGSWERAIVAINSNAGSEYDIKDEYGDHSCYRKMLKMVMDLGYCDNKLNFDALDEYQKGQLYYLIKAKVNAPTSCIKKFLHFDLDKTQKNQ